MFTLSNLAYPKWVLDKALFKAKRNHYRNFCGKIDKSVDVSVKDKLLVVPFTPVLNDVRRPLRRFNTRIMFSYKNKIGNSLVKNRPKKSISSGVYEIPCDDCDMIYTGETGRDFKERIVEHKRDIRNNKVESGIAQHSNRFNHNFNFNKAKIIFHCHKTRRRKVVESALIRKHIVDGVSCNLNKGFSPQNEILSDYITDVLYLKK